MHFIIIELFSSSALCVQERTRYIMVKKICQKLPLFTSTGVLTILNNCRLGLIIFSLLKTFATRSPKHSSQWIRMGIFTWFMAGVKYYNDFCLPLDFLGIMDLRKILKATPKTTPPYCNDTSTLQIYTTTLRSNCSHPSYKYDDWL